ncbi:MAG: 3-oxoacyl-[acyl-carrier-protein] reductase [Ignavibacteriales bacterium]
MSLKGKTAVITGSSRGIGRAIALKLADMGADIVLNATVNSDAIDQVEKEIKAKGVKVLTIKCDISNFEEVEKLFEEVIKQFGKVDILVNNAGITKDGLLLRMNENDWNEVLDTNLKSVFNCTKIVSKVMIKNKSGKIINMSSISGITGAAGQTNYSASKAGVIGFTKAAAREFASRGITVNAIAPGFIQSRMTDKLPEQIKEEYLSNIPLKRFGTPEEVADLVGFLASDKANYITGQVIHIDGGMVM